MKWLAKASPPPEIWSPSTQATALISPRAAYPRQWLQRTSGQQMRDGAFEANGERWLMQSLLQRERRVAQNFDCTAQHPPLFVSLFTFPFTSPTLIRTATVEAIGDDARARARGSSSAEAEPQKKKELVRTGPSPLQQALESNAALARMRDTERKAAVATSRRLNEQVAYLTGRCEELEAAVEELRVELVNSGSYKAGLQWQVYSKNAKMGELSHSLAEEHDQLMRSHSSLRAQKRERTNACTRSRTLSRLALQITF